jgi:hypothetical protein
MYEGKIVGMCAPDIPEQELGLLMAGAATADAQGSLPGNGTAPHRPDADELLQTGLLPTDPARPRDEEPPGE